MAPSAIGPVKTMLRSLEIGPLKAYMAERIGLPHASLRRDLTSYARDHGVAL
jgi:phosphotransferase system enzyme I (PtsP)